MTSTPSIFTSLAANRAIREMIDAYGLEDSDEVNMIPSVSVEIEDVK